MPRLIDFERGVSRCFCNVTTKKIFELLICLFIYGLFVKYAVSKNE